MGFIKRGIIVSKRKYINSIIIYQKIIQKNRIIHFWIGNLKSDSKICYDQKPVIYKE
jgi:hypothetical protein